jgi:hypothetical protein
MDDDRRRVLRALAGSAAGATALAGCLGGGSGGDGDGDGSDRPADGDTGPTGPKAKRAGTRTTERRSPTRTPGETPTVASGPARTDTRTDTRADTRTDRPPASTAETAETDGRETGRVVLERVDGRPTGTVTVYQRSLRETLREAATTDGVVRTVAEATVDNPQPVLPSFGSVELVDESGAASGVYDLVAEGGTNYRMALEAREVTDPDGPVTSLSALPSARREFLRSAIRDEFVSVTPQTERGEWVRHEVFGHAFEADGTVYRFREWSATDAAFFSDEVWYTLALEPTDQPAETPVRLRLAEAADDVRATLDPLVESGTYRRAPERVASDPGPLPEAVTVFADRTDGLLIHVGALALAIE